MIHNCSVLLSYADVVTTWCRKTVSKTVFKQPTNRLKKSIKTPLKGTFSMTFEGVFKMASNFSLQFRRKY